MIAVLTMENQDTRDSNHVYNDVSFVEFDNRIDLEAAVDLMALHDLRFAILGYFDEVRRVPETMTLLEWIEDTSDCSLDDSDTLDSALALLCTLPTELAAAFLKWCDTDLAEEYRSRQGAAA